MLRKTLISLALILALCAVGVAGFAMLARLRKPPSRQTETLPLITVHAERLARRAFTEEHRVYGEAHALRDVTVSAEIAGTVEWIAPSLEAGAHVKSDEVLVKLNDRDYVIARDEALARFEQAKGETLRALRLIKGIERQLELARKEWEVSKAELARLERLVASGTSAQSELDAQRRFTTALERAVIKMEEDLAEARLAVDVDRAAERAAKAGLDRAQRDLSRCEVTASFEGVVVSRSVAPGTHVSVGTALFRVIDPTRLEVRLSLPARVYGEVGVGAHVVLRRPGREKVLYRGELVRTSAIIDPDQRVFDAFAEITEEGGAGRIASGDFVVGFVAGQHFEDVFVLPRTSVLDGKVHLVRLDGDAKDGVVELAPVEPIRALPDVLLVKDGLKAGDLVVLDGLEKIASSSRVRVRIRKDRPFEAENR